MTLQAVHHVGLVVRDLDRSLTNSGQWGIGFGTPVLRPGQAGALDFGGGPEGHHAAQ